MIIYFILFIIPGYNDHGNETHQRSPAFMLCATSAGKDQFDFVTLDLFQIVATLLWDLDKLKPLLDYATDLKVCSLPERRMLTDKENAKKGKDAKFHLYCSKNLSGPKKKIPQTQIHKDTKTNKDKDKISPILPERDLPRPLSNAGSCSTNYSTAPTSPLKKEAVIFNTLSIGDVHTSLQNSICCLLFSRTLHNKKYLHLS